MTETMQVLGQRHHGTLLDAACIFIDGGSIILTKERSDVVPRAQVSNGFIIVFYRVIFVLLTKVQY